ncbi:MAG: glycosyltransferase, partial [Candidatus Staskawiczbacteria bacterium]|nr:glycosyltransferase [Candidatus Staskawiczbacteria bacterium]
MENKNKKNIGIIFPPRSGNGGIFQYAMSVAEALINFCGDFNYIIFYFDEKSPKDCLMIENKGNVNFIALKKRKENLIFKAGVAVGILTGKPIFTIGKHNKEILKKAKIDLLIITSPLLAGFEYDIPFIFPILDVMYINYHLYFPEYSALKTRIVSQVVIKDLADRSKLSIACSEWDKNDIVKFLKQSQNKLVTIPMVPPGYVYSYKDMSQAEADGLIRKYNLPEKFLFYPAQFFPHKNHLRLIESIKILKEKYREKVNLVLAGNPKVNIDNYNKVKELIRKFNIEDQIFILGYIEDKEVVALYKKSTSLILPTFSGPTNLTP